ncbi:hypothetical protein PHYPSEUDO_015090 [Phytophthora pseudosyringae]|uniref:Uncharacterized protein n=1 Tax=Phytophthora pseudosyringae TaxID=221518 RepID=A0A8T1W094_9STRA|nr:hypothetical protein PHYPSEUDO_015090 [Phytophthora pseudosyringae]
MRPQLPRSSDHPLPEGTGNRQPSTPGAEGSPRSGARHLGLRGAERVWWPASSSEEYLRDIRRRESQGSYSLPEHKLQAQYSPTESQPSRWRWSRQAPCHFRSSNLKGTDAKIKNGKRNLGEAHGTVKATQYSTHGKGYFTAGNTTIVCHSSGPQTNSAAVSMQLLVNNRDNCHSQARTCQFISIVKLGRYLLHPPTVQLGAMFQYPPIFTVQVFAQRVN